MGGNASPPDRRLIGGAVVAEALRANPICGAAYFFLFLLFLLDNLAILSEAVCRSEDDILSESYSIFLGLRKERSRGKK